VRSITRLQCAVLSLLLLSSLGVHWTTSPAPTISRFAHGAHCYDIFHSFRVLTTPQDEASTCSWQTAACVLRTLSYLTSSTETVDFHVGTSSLQSVRNGSLVRRINGFVERPLRPFRYIDVISSMYSLSATALLLLLLLLVRSQTYGYRGIVNRMRGKQY
jgi:hypothetical protein